MGKRLEQTFLQRRDTMTHIKSYSVSAVIREMQIKTTKRYNFVHTRMATIKINGKSQVLMWMGRNWNPRILPLGMQNGTAAVQNSLAVPQKVKHRITIGPFNSTPRYIHKRTENRYSKSLCIHTFILALFTIAKR